HAAGGLALSWSLHQRELVHVTTDSTPREGAESYLTNYIRAAIGNEPTSYLNLVYPAMAAFAVAAVGALFPVIQQGTPPVYAQPAAASGIPLAPVAGVANPADPDKWVPLDRWASRKGKKRRFA